MRKRVTLEKLIFVFFSCIIIALLVYVFFAARERQVDITKEHPPFLGPKSNLFDRFGQLFFFHEPFSSAMMRYGAPEGRHYESSLGFAYEYDSRLKISLWCYELITEEMVKEPVASLVCPTKQPLLNPALSPSLQPTVEEFHRNNLRPYFFAAPPFHRSSKEEFEESFYMTNAALFTIDPWMGKAVFDIERRIAEFVQKQGSAHIITGPIFASDHRLIVPLVGPSKVALPSHFFKVILLERKEGTFSLYALIYPNGPLERYVPPRCFATSLGEVERLTGLHLFPQFEKKTGYSLDRQAIHPF